MLEDDADIAAGHLRLTAQPAIFLQATTKYFNAAGITLTAFEPGDMANQRRLAGT